MDIFYSVIAISITIFLVISGWWILNLVWFGPKKLEKCFREQGFFGNPYRILFGDAREILHMQKEAKSKPINFTNDIIPRVIPFINKSYKTYEGKNLFIWLGSKPGLVIMDSELIREVFAKSYVYQKIPGNAISKLLAQGLATYDTEKWAKHRRLINPAFHLDKVKLMLPAFHLSCSEMLSKWEKLTAVEGSCEMDVLPYLQTMTSDVISRTAFGSNYEEGRKIFELQRELVELIMQLTESFTLPGLRFLPTKRNRRMKRISREAHESVLRIINKRVKKMQEDRESSHDDLLGILLESNFKEIEEHGNNNNNNNFGMSFEEIVEECKLFYFAGQETTANLLVWTMILLGKHSDWQARARDEVLRTFGNNQPDFKGLNHLKIVTMIMNEVLRLYPPAVMFARIVKEDTKLRELFLPDKTLILLPTILLQHDEKIWGADAKEFNPERFSEGISKATNGQLVYFPFGWGPRICIGQNFAMLEAKMALALILQSFSFELSPSYAHSPRTLVTLLPQHGAHLILHKL